MPSLGCRTRRRKSNYPRCEMTCRARICSRTKPLSIQIRIYCSSGQFSGSFRASSATYHTLASWRHCRLHLLYPCRMSKSWTIAIHGWACWQRAWMFHTHSHSAAWCLPRHMTCLAHSPGPAWRYCKPTRHSSEANRACCQTWRL